ncbi:MAG: hypothetical protein DMG41_17270 [Acidobacteria bacterium]|nr:MAG: hypothetical protein AUH13_12615 [Acidobacteria bacterium 13_2_20CM_58_27]PYT67697.1 MAG: hypothetical protein DMG42_26195 [Acidobacteriota bacterium]PYT86894.1 MAG: hypothetical protein DMG41_17270 [Acidobacteriota bacterium]
MGAIIPALPAGAGGAHDSSPEARRHSLALFFLNTGNVLSSPLRTPRLLCRVLSFPFFRLLNLFPRH